MTHRKLIIVIVAGVVALGVGYGLMGLAAPESSGATAAGSSGFVLDEVALQAALAGPDGTGPRVVVVDATTPNSTGGGRADARDVRGDHDDDHDDDDHDDDDHHKDHHKDHHEDDHKGDKKDRRHDD